AQKAADYMLNISEMKNYKEVKIKALALEIELDLLSLEGIGKIDEEILDELAHLYENATIGKRVISPVRLGRLDKSEVIKLKVETGKDFTLFRREIFYNDARHIYNNHGRPEEKYRHQIAVTTNDFLLIPIILKKYDSVEFEPKEKGKNSSDCLIYRKKFAGKYFIVEEIIYQENLLKVKTMRIEK
ncbi:MAG: hypothetical protein K8R85_05975, partial [Bacteroidetes bacterium]|nr:hypothetical protein [Bacteroidota bacterium]